MAISNLNDQIQGLLSSFKKGQLLGIDIGLSAIKLALLSPLKKNNYRLEKFYHLSLPEAAIIEDEIQRPMELVELLKEGIQKIDYKNRIACIGVDGPNTMTKRLQIPDGSKEEIEDNVLWESEQYIPFGADDSEVDFQVIGDAPDSDDTKDIIVSAAKTSMIESFTKVVEDAELTVKVVDLKMFALSNIFESIYNDRLEELNEGAIIIDFGAQFTKIMVYKYGAPILTKEVIMGGVLITEEIQRRMSVSYEEAEDLKVGGSETNSLPEEITPIIDGHIESLLGEIKKVLNFYIASGSSEKVEFCFITGGSSRLPGLVEQLEETIAMPVEIIDPFLRLEVSNKISEDELALVQKLGLVSLGLGMRKV